MRARRYGSNQIASEAERDDDRRAPARASRTGVPGDEQHRAEHHDDRDRGAEVGLGEDQDAEEAERARPIGRQSSCSVLRRAAARAR